MCNRINCYRRALEGVVTAKLREKKLKETYSVRTMEQNVKRNHALDSGFLEVLNVKYQYKITSLRSPKKGFQLIHFNPFPVVDTAIGFNRKHLPSSQFCPVKAEPQSHR